MKIAAGPWLPDQPAFGNPGLLDVRDAIPAGTHYRPLGQLQGLSAQTLPIPAQGLFIARRANGDLLQIYGGGDRLWRIPGHTGALVDVSRGDYGYDYLFQPEDRWRGVQFGDRLILTNFRDEIQSLDLDGSPLRFEDLDATAPRAKYIAVVRDLLVVAYTFDGIDGEDAFRVRWPGIVNGLPDPTSWTIDLATQADFQRIADIGIITGLTGGQFGTVLCEHGIVRMTYGGPALFQFDTIESDSIGCNAPGSVIKYQQQTYFWSEEGWYRFNGQSAEAIGADSRGLSKINRWFANDFDLDSASSMWAGRLFEYGVLAWLYAGSGAESGMPNRMLLYNTRTNEWAKADVSADLIGPALSFGLDLDDETAWPDLDTDPRDLDDPALWGVAVRSGAVLDDQLLAFTGAPMTALFEPGEFEINEGGRGMLDRSEVLHEGGTATLRVGTREQQPDAMTFGTTHTRQTDGFFRFREPGRRHRLRVELAGNWSRFLGVDVFGAKLGQR